MMWVLALDTSSPGGAWRCCATTSRDRRARRRSRRSATPSGCRAPSPRCSPTAAPAPSRARPARRGLGPGRLHRPARRPGDRAGPRPGSRPAGRRRVVAGRGGVAALSTGRPTGPPAGCGSTARGATSSRRRSRRPHAAGDWPLRRARRRRRWRRHAATLERWRDCVPRGRAAARWARRARGREEALAAGHRIVAAEAPLAVRGRPDWLARPRRRPIRATARAGAVVRPPARCRGRARTPAAASTSHAVMVTFGRLTSAADLDGILALDALCFHRPWTRADYERELADPARCYLYVARDAGRRNRRLLLVLADLRRGPRQQLRGASGVAAAGRSAGRCWPTCSPKRPALGAPRATLEVRASNARGNRPVRGRRIRAGRPPAGATTRIPIEDALVLWRDPPARPAAAPADDLEPPGRRC